jgi:hypothetical protein
VSADTPPRHTVAQLLEGAARPRQLGRVFAESPPQACPISLKCTQQLGDVRIAAQCAVTSAKRLERLRQHLRIASCIECVRDIAQQRILATIDWLAERRPQQPQGRPGPLKILARIVHCCVGQARRCQRSGCAPGKVTGRATQGPRT